MGDQETGVVYKLTNRTFANDGAVDTGIEYLTTDKSFTIMCDADFAGQQAERTWCLFKIMNPTSPYPGVAITQLSRNFNYMLVVWMTAKEDKKIPLAYSYVGKVKIVLTHFAGSGTMNYYVQVGDSAVVTGRLTERFTTITSNLAVGGSLSNSQLFNGTVNNFTLYDEVK